MIAAKERRPRRVVRVLSEVSYERAARNLLKMIPHAIDPQQVRVDIARLSGRLTSTEVAGALSGLPAIATQIAEATILANAEAERTVKVWFLAVVIRLSHERNWGIDFDRKQILAGFAAGDVFPPRCDTCKSRCVVPNARGHEEICPQCGGVGVIRKKEYEKARLFDVSPGEWSRKWNGRVRDIVATYQHHEGMALKRLHEVFCDE